MAFKNRKATYAYHHPDWKDGSYWTFRAEMSLADSQAIQNLTTKTTVGEIDPQSIRERARQGRDFRDLVKQEQVMDPVVARLLQMSVSWEGEDFIVPPDFLVRDTKTGKEIPHPTAKVGELAPLDALCIAEQDAGEIEALLRVMGSLWAGGSREDLETFPFSGTRLDRSDSGSDAPAEVSNGAAGDQPVSLAAAGARRRNPGAGTA